MTSERNERVEEESTNRCAGRWKERPREQAKGRNRCPCVLMEGGREDGGVWSGCWGETWEINKSLRIQKRFSPKENDPCYNAPQHRVSAKASVKFPRLPTRIKVEFEEFFLQTWTETFAESFLTFSTDKNRNPHAGCGLSDQPVWHPRLLKKLG